MFDELLPWRVAKALQVLQFQVTYVGDEQSNPPSPARGSSDEDVLAHSSKCNQIIVTSNLDMVLLCVERGESVIWIDPYGRQLRREETALLALKRIRTWAELFDNALVPRCVRTLRSKVERLSLEEAELRVRKRMGALARRHLNA